MDWTKAKTILIIALIVTDIFLIATYGGKNGEKEFGNEEALIAILESSNIYVDAEKIPEKHRNMPALAVEYRSVSQDEIDALIESTEIEAVDDSDEAYTEAAEDFVSCLGMMSEYISGAHVVRTSKEKEDDDSENGGGSESSGEDVKVVFGCEADGTKLDGSYIICTFEGRKVSGFNSYWLEPGEFSARKQETISAAVALITYMSEREGREEVHISDIELVYWVNSASYDSMAAVTDTALPTWRITFENGETVHIEAFER